jgi:hypothetical protein
LPASAAPEEEPPLEELVDASKPPLAPPLLLPPTPLLPPLAVPLLPPLDALLVVPPSPTTAPDEDSDAHAPRTTRVEKVTGTKASQGAVFHTISTVALGLSVRPTDGLAEVPRRVRFIHPSRRRSGSGAGTYLVEGVRFLVAADARPPSIIAQRRSLGRSCSLSAASAEVSLPPCARPAMSSFASDAGSNRFARPRRRRQPPSLRGLPPASSTVIAKS